MKNKIWLTFLATILVASLVAFGACKAEEEPPVVEEVWDWPPALTIGTGLMESTPSIVALGWTPLLERDTGMKVRVIAESNNSIKRRWLRAGTVDAYHDSMAETANSGMEARTADATRDGGALQIRLVWSCIDFSVGFLVRGDSPIETVYDIKPGMTAACFDIGGVIDATKGLLAWAGVDEDDINWLKFGGWTPCVRAVVDGKADFTYLVTFNPGLVEAAAAPHGIRFMELPASKDPEGASRLLAFRPTLTFGITTSGVKESHGVEQLMTFTPEMCLADKDPELIYQLVKWLDENYDRYKDVHEMAVGMSIDSFRTLLDTTFLPVHEGTIRYLKEKGLWTADDDRRQEYNIELIDRYIAAYEIAISMADDKGIKVDPENEEWIELWENYKKEINIPTFKVMLEIP